MVACVHGYQVGSAVTIGVAVAGIVLLGIKLGNIMGVAAGSVGVSVITLKTSDGVNDGVGLGVSVAVGGIRGVSVAVNVGV